MAHGPASSTPSVSPNDPPQSNPPAASIALSPVMEEHTREMQSNSSSSSNYSGSITSYTIDEPPVNRNNLSIAETKHTIREHRYLEWDTPLADILALSPTVSSDEPIDLPTEKPTGAISNTNSPSTFPSPRPRHEPQIPPKFFKIKDPFTWNRTQKFIVTVICCYSTITAAWASAGYAMGVNYMVQEWKVDKHQVMLGLPMFTIGFSLTPMIMSPISEVYGRRNVLIGSQWAMVLCQVGCGFVRSPGANLILRLLLGCAASPSSSLVGGMIADCHHAAERGLPMAFFSSMGLMATGLGPLVSGFVVEHLGWRWITWLQLIINGVGSIFCLFFMKETRGSVLLAKRAKILNKWMDEVEAGKNIPVRIRWRTKSEEATQSLKQMIRVSLTRPFYFLLTESVVFWFSVWVSFVWCCLYLFLSSIPYVFTQIKHFTPSHAGLMFLSLIIGAYVAQTLVTFTEYLLNKSKYISSRNGTTDRTRFNPEARLYASCLYAPLLPIGIFMFGFTALDQPVYVPGIAMGLMTMGIYTVYLAVFNYLADTYHRYASSALAAQSMCRNLLGGFFPLLGEKAYDGIGIKAGSSAIASFGVALCVVPWVLVIWGEKIRGRSKFCSEMEGKGEEADS